MAQTDLNSQLHPGQLLLQIVTPEGCAYRGYARLVELPTGEGELGIFPGHVALFAELGTGEIRAYGQDQIDRFAVSGGYLVVEPDSIRIVAHFVSAGEDEARIDEACRRAEAALEMRPDLDPERLDKNLLRLRIELQRLKKGGSR